MIFKNFVKSSPFLYKIWFYSIRNRTGDRVRLPEKSDHLYFDGYPRSGNTYFSGLISYIFKDVEFTSHLHVIAGIKMALNKGLPVIIIIRNPEDAVISNLFRVTRKKDFTPSQQLIDDLILEYIDYYSYVNKKKDKLNVLDFSIVTEEPINVLELVSSKVFTFSKSDKEFESLIDDFDKRMKNQESKKVTATSALPSEERKAFKTKHRELALNSKHIEKANEIYNALTLGHL